MSHKHNLNTYTPDFTIDPITREIIQVSNPENPIRLMQFDHNSEKLRFSCPRYIDGHDMALCNKLEVHFVNSDVANEINNSGAYRVVDLEVDSADSSKINFSWVVSKNATGNVGTLVFSVRFTCLSGDEIDYVWHTLSFTYISVDQGLVSEISEEYQKIYLDNLETEAGKKVVEAAEATNTALEAAERASEAVNDLYSMDITDKAPAIVCEASGEVISITDSANMPLKGLRLFGKSTQDGTPTPDAPVEIVSVEKPVVTVCGKNLLNVGEHFTFTGTKGINVYLPAGDYVLSFESETHEGTSHPEFRFYDNKNWTTIEGNSVVKRITLSKPETNIYVYSNGTSNANSTGVSATIEKLMVSKVGGDYEPYSGQTIPTTHTLPGIPVTSGGNYTDSDGQQWICDEVDLERGVFVQRVIAKRVLSSDNWASDESNGRYWLNDTDFNNINPGCICTHFVKASTWNNHMNTTGTFMVYRDPAWTYGRLSFKVESIITLDDWKQFITNNEIYVIYELATSVETPLSETEISAYKALHTNKPNTIILNDGTAWQSVDYVADTKLYIDKKIKELVTALVSE